MFKRKYTVSLLDSKWVVLKRDVKLSVIPRRDEYLYFDNQYYEVLNVVHMLNNKQDIFVIINGIQNKNLVKTIENQ
jgi:hypothetical protein